MPLTLTVTESGGFELHEADEWYDGTIADIEETDGQWGPGVKFIVNLDGEVWDDGNPRDTWAFASQKLSKRSKLYKWATALGWEPESETLDLNDFIQTRCQVMFELYDGYDADSNPVEKEKVVKMRQGKGKPAAKKKAAKVVEDDDTAPF